MVADDNMNIGIWGQFDTDQIDAHIRLRVAAHELTRRLPTATFRVFAPFAPTQLPVTAGLAIESLSNVVDHGLAGLAHELALIVRVGDVDPSPYDEAGRSKTEVAAAIELFNNPPQGVASTNDPRAIHPGLLTRRVWDTAFCLQRLEFLRAMHWWPQTGPAIVVDDTAAGLDVAVGVQAQRPECAIVVIHPAPGSSAPAGAHALPKNQSSIEDAVSAIAHAEIIITHDDTLRAIAASFNVEVHDAPHRPAQIATDIVALDNQYDEIVRLIGTEPQTALATDEIRALRAALVVHQRRLAHERVVFADYVRAIRSNAARDIKQARESRTLFDKVSSRILKRR